MAPACPAWPWLLRAPRGQADFSPPSTPVVCASTSARTALSAATMVNIHTHTLSFWRARRRRLRVGLVIGHGMELTLADMSPLVAAYRRAHREVVLSLARTRRVTAARFNLNSFCSSEALSLFRFLPSDVGRLADLLQVQDAVAMTKYAVTPVECLCIVLRRLASPARWVGLEELFGRSSSALCTIFFVTIGMLLEIWGS